MKQENDKKLKWIDPCLILINRRKSAFGICGTGGSPTLGPECSNGGVAANACADGASVITL